jgi:hypothetical protein
MISTHKACYSALIDEFKEKNFFEIYRTLKLNTDNAKSKFDFIEFKASNINDCLEESKSRINKNPHFSAHALPFLSIYIEFNNFNK